MRPSAGWFLLSAVRVAGQHRYTSGKRRCPNCVRLVRDLAHAEAHLARLEQQIRDLKEKLGSQSEMVVELEREIEEWRRGYRARGKRYPQRQAGGRGAPKRAGRPAGNADAFRPRPDECDRTVPMPAGPCEKCGGKTREAGAALVYCGEEIRLEREVVGYALEGGECVGCGHRQYAKLPAELGPRPMAGTNAQALVVTLRKDMGLSFGKIARLFRVCAAFEITRGGLVQMMGRTRERLLRALTEIQQRLRSLPFAHMDESGARHRGRSTHLWIACHKELSFFEHGPGRDYGVVVRILGDDYAGIVVVDSYAAYPKYIHDAATAGASLQACWAHLLREAVRVAEIEGSAQAADFHRRLRAVYLRAMGVAEVEEPWLNRPGVARLQARMVGFAEPLLRFVETPGLPADNNQAERDLRRFVMLRHTSFCTRSNEGMMDLTHLLSRDQTLRKQGRTWFEYLSAALAAYHRRRPFPSVFAPRSARERGAGRADARMQGRASRGARRRPRSVLAHRPSMI